MDGRQISTKREQGALAARLRSEGKTWAEIASIFRKRYRVNGRVAMRLAHGLSQKGVADAWNARWPDHPKSYKNISYWEQWPGPSGHQPSLVVLSRLAEIYECSVTDLVADYGDYKSLDKVHTVRSNAKQRELTGTARTPLSLEEEEDMERRKLLENLAALGVSTSPAARGLEMVRGSIGQAFQHDERDHPDEWESVITEYGYTYMVTSPAQLMPDLVEDLISIRSIISEIGVDDSAYGDWCRIGGLLSGLTAKTLSNLGRPREARQWWNTAQRITHASHDLESELWVRGERIISALYEQKPPQLILRQIDETNGLAEKLVCAGSAKMSTGRAQALALLGEHKAAEKELRHTAKILEQLPSSAVTDEVSVMSWGESRLRYTETWVHSYAGNEERTDDAASRAISLYSAADSRSPVQIELMQAFSRVQSGDVSEGLRQAQTVYTALSGNQRTSMIDSLATKILRGIPDGARHLAVANDYRELLTSNSKGYGT